MSVRSKSAPHDGSPTRPSSPGNATEPPASPITDRQLEILLHVAQGRTNREIGKLLGISERTVRNHLRAIGQRLSTSDRTHAVVLAIGHGWIPIPVQPDGRLTAEVKTPRKRAAAG